MLKVWGRRGEAAGIQSGTSYPAIIQRMPIGR